MAIVYLALGSNVGDRHTFLGQAVTLLKASVSDMERAPLYTSRAVGYTKQADFLNTVVRGQTVLSPKELLLFVKTVEKKVGRIARFRWGPREIDIDIIFYDTVMVTEPDLTIPHPRFTERDFVLKPLQDLAPTFIDPLTKKTIRRLYNELPKNSHSIIRPLSPLSP